MRFLFVEGTPMNGYGIIMDGDVLEEGKRQKGVININVLISCGIFNTPIILRKHSRTRRHQELRALVLPRSRCGVL